MNDTVKKDVQDTSCRGSGGKKKKKKVPQDWGVRGLIESNSAASEYMNNREAF